VVVAQVDEEHAAVVPHAVHPARQPNGLARVGRVQVGAGMAAVGVHDAPLSEGRNPGPRRYTASDARSQGGARRRPRRQLSPKPPHSRQIAGREANSWTLPGPDPWTLPAPWPLTP